MSVAVPETSDLSSSQQLCFFRTFMDPPTEVSFHLFALGQFHLLSQLVFNYLNVLGCFGWEGLLLLLF